MPDSISTLTLRISSDEAMRDLTQFKNATNDLGNVAMGVKGKLLSLFSAGVGMKLGRDMLAAAADNQEALGKYVQVFGKYKTEADKAVKELTASFNFAEAQAQQQMATLADVFQKTGLSMRDSLDLTSQLTKTAADIEAFTNAAGGLEQVSGALTSAMLGRYQSVRQFGIVLSDQLIKEEKARQAQKGLTFANEQAATSYARFSLILKQTAMAQGQVARESDNYSNKMRNFRARVSDLTGNLGAALVGPATKVVDALTKVTTAVNSLSPRMKTAVVATGAATIAMLAIAPAAAKVFIALKLLRSGKVEDKLATDADTKSQFSNSGAMQTNTNISAKATVQKHLEAEARLLNAKAIQAENLALAGQSRANATSAFSSIPSKADKRAAKIAWRAQTEGARKFAAMPGAMPYTTAKLGKNVAQGAIGKVGNFAALSNLVPMAKKLLAPLGKLNSIFGKIFKSVATKLPLLSSFSGVLGTALGLLGTGATVIGGVVIALKAFKEAPQYLEMFLQEGLPKIKDFATNIPTYIWAGIKEGFELGKKGVEKVGDLAVDGVLGAAQFGKRLLGFETEASRQYELNKKWEENNKKREALLQQEKEQRAAEEKILIARESADKLRTKAQLEYNDTKDTDATKLAKAIQQRDSKAAEISSMENRLRQLQTIVSNPNADSTQRSEAIKEADNLLQKLEERNAEWKEAAENVDKLADSVHEASESFKEDQKSFSKTKEEAQKNFEESIAQQNFDNANSFIARQNALGTLLQRRQSEYDESVAAEGIADEKNTEIQRIQGLLTNDKVGSALADLRTLAESGDFQSQQARLQYASATARLSDAGYDLTDSDYFFGKGSAQQLVEKITASQKDDQNRLGTLIAERDEQLQIAGERASRFSALSESQKAISDGLKEQQEAVALYDRQNAEKERQRQREEAAQERSYQDTYFKRQLRASDEYFGKDALGAAQSRYQLIGARGAQDWQTSVEALEAQKKYIDDLNRQISIYDSKWRNGTLTDDEAKERERLLSERDTRQSEYDSDYKDAVQRRISNEDELLGLESTMRSEYLKEIEDYAGKQADEMRKQLTAQAQAEEEQQRVRLEERSRMEEERRQAVQGQKAITAGSSEAFAIASRIYDRGREELPPEKKIEKSTEQIEEYVKAMQETLVEYLTGNAGNLTLSMGY